MRVYPDPESGYPPKYAREDIPLRVLRYLPTNLSIPEIANELYVSRNTVKTHIRHLYGTLGTHRREDGSEP